MKNKVPASGIINGSPFHQHKYPFYLLKIIEVQKNSIWKGKSRKQLTVSQKNWVIIAKQKKPSNTKRSRSSPSNWGRKSRELAAAWSVLLAKNNKLQLVVSREDTSTSNGSEDVGPSTLEERLGSFVLQDLVEGVQWALVLDCLPWWKIKYMLIVGWTNPRNRHMKSTYHTFDSRMKLGSCNWYVFRYNHRMISLHRLLL